MTQSSPTPAAPRPHRRHLWGILAATVVLIGFLVLRRPRQEPNPVTLPPTLSFTTEELRLLYADRNAAIGEIEGALGAGNLTAALGLLEEIERRLPGDRFPQQNRAVALVMALQVQDKPTSPRVSPDDVLAELDLLKQAEPTNPVPWLLAAHVAEKSGDGEQLLVQGRKAAELAPQDPVAWYALAKAGDYLADDDPARDECRQALAKALDLDPENSHLLRLQAKTLAYARDPAVIPVLERLASQTALLDLVRRTDGAKGDPRELIDAAIDAARKEDWSTAAVSAERLGNIIMRQDWVRSDLRRLEPNPLNYIALDFQTAVESPAIPLPPLAVPQFAPSKKLPPLAGLASATPATPLQLELADVDSDGRLDLLVLAEKSLQIFTQGDAGWRPLLEHPLSGQFTRLLIADLDRDESPKEQPRPTEPLAPADPRVCGTADPDFILAGPAGLLVLKNELQEGGGRQLVVVSQPEPFAALRDLTAATLVDLDQDGDLDLALGPPQGVQFWRNRGDLVFEDVTSRSQLPPPATRVSELTVVHWNHDCFLDLIALTATGEVACLENVGHATFRWRPLPEGFRGLGTATALAVLDADGNADWDLIATGPQGTSVARSRAGDVGEVQFLDLRPHRGRPAERLLLGDLNNDSWLDALTWTAGANGSEADLLWGAAAGQLTPNFAGTGLPGQFRDATLGDLDADGDLDLVVVTSTGLETWENPGVAEHHHTTIRLRAQPADAVARVNHLALGSVAELWVGSEVRRQMVTGQFTHFGMGRQPQADLLRVVFTNCVPQNHLRPEADQPVCEVQFPSTSCPFVYAWNGERFEFLYDFLWGAPLGLQFAEGVIAPAQPAEHLLIPGERLQPRDGRLVLQLTEELQEATYIDRLQLIAVDHPAEVEVFTNEKVGPPDVAAHRLHTIRERHAPVAARSSSGRDLLDELLLADGRYARPFEAPLRSGRVETHFLELDLGDLGPPEQLGSLLLVLSGHIYPTATSVAIGLGQNPAYPPGLPPRLLLPDGQGGWRVARDFTGFPGGKNKTIVLDLTGLFTSPDYRLRLETNFEFCWDEAFFARNEQPVEVRETLVPLARADLHYRGYSQRVPQPHHAPDTYLYDQVETSCVWLPMDGLFTRWGDVQPLLETADDQLLVFGFGDEVTLEFTPPPPPPPGWKRDYILHSIGWDKDCDPNILTGTSVEPLPFRAQTTYPHGATESPPATPEYLQYLKTYQTRRLDRMAFWRGR